MDSSSPIFGMNIKHLWNHHPALPWHEPWNAEILIGSSSRIPRSLYISWLKWNHWPVDGQNPAPVEVGSFPRSLQGVSTISGGWRWDFWTINTRNDSHDRSMEKWYVYRSMNVFFWQLLGKDTICGSHEILLMEEILHQSVGSWNPIIYKVYTFHVVSRLSSINSFYLFWNGSWTAGRIFSINSIIVRSPFGCFQK